MNSHASDLERTTGDGSLPDSRPKVPSHSASSRVARKEWDRAYQEHPTLAADFAWQHVIDVLDAYPGERVYEIGFGSGRNLSWARERGWEVAGCEVASKPFALGKALLPGADLWRESIVDCSAPSEHYDLVIDRAALSYLSPQDLVTAFDHIARILKPGGVFYFNPYGVEHSKPFPEFAPEPTRWAESDAHRLFSETVWEGVDSKSWFAKYNGDEEEEVEHTLRIVVRKLGAAPGRD